MSSVVLSKLLYAAPVWTNALKNQAIHRKLFSAQRSVALRIVSAYRTASTSARMEGADSSRRRRLVEKAQTRWYGEQTGRWTYRLIPELATWLNRKHGEVGFYLAQALSGHGCFKAYLRRFQTRDEAMCCYCDSLWIMRSTHSSSAQSGAWQGGPPVRQ